MPFLRLWSLSRYAIKAPNQLLFSPERHSPQAAMHEIYSKYHYVNHRMSYIYSKCCKNYLQPQAHYSENVVPCQSSQSPQTCWYKLYWVQRVRSATSVMILCHSCRRHYQHDVQIKWCYVPKICSLIIFYKNIFACLIFHTSVVGLDPGIKLRRVFLVACVFLLVTRTSLCNI